MTIKFTNYAILPKRCSKCNRRFIFEPYLKYYRLVGIEEYMLKCVECKYCREEELENENT